MNVGSSLFARMRFVLTKGFTQASDRISVLCATDLSIPHPTFVFMNRWFNKYKYYHADGHLSGVMVSVFTIGPKVCGCKCGQGNGILRAIKIHSTLSFGGEAKLEAPCHKTLLHVKAHLQI
jgi:hypothetical protein